MTYQFDPILGQGRDGAVSLAEQQAGFNRASAAEKAAFQSAVSQDWADVIPLGGIPSSDFTPGVQSLLGKADTALQKSALLAETSKYLGVVFNGSGAQGDNTNFSSSTFETADVPFGAAGCFTYTSAGAVIVAESDSYLPVDPYSVYQVVIDAKQLVGAGGSFLYAGFSMYDRDGQIILPEYATRYAGSDTTLAAPLAPGDTVISLNSATGWAITGGANDAVAFFTYRDSFGYAYLRDVLPYTRYTSYSGAPQFASIAGNTITLSAPFAYANPAAGSGGVWPAGTPVSQPRGGSTFNYRAIDGVTVPGDRWTRYTNFIGGIDMLGSLDTSYFRAGTAKLKFLLLPNYGGAAGSKVGVSNIGLYRAPVTRAMAGLA